MDWAEQHLAELFNGRDRERAIVGAELLSAKLENLLSAFMTGPPDLVAKLLNAEKNAYALLGGFRARIDLCEALAILPEKTAADLRLIAMIRNRFAHRLDYTFDTQEIRNHIAKLHVAKIVNATPGPLAPRTAFSATAMERFWQLQVIRDAVVGGRRPEQPIEIDSAFWTNENGLTIGMPGHKVTLHTQLKIKKTGEQDAVVTL